MKVLDVALKDMRQSFRSRSAIIFMFVVPVLVTVLFALMFGDIAGDEEGFTLPQTAVILVNLDEGQVPAQFGLGESRSMGDLLAQLLQGEQLADLIVVAESPDIEAAQRAVDEQEAGVAVIIPAAFTDALTGGGEAAEVELYADPTLTIGPAIVDSIVRQMVDGFAASNISAAVTLSQLEQAGVSITPDMVQTVIDYQAENMQFLTGETELIDLQAPSGGGGQANALTDILSLILAGMLVFYAFFTGANVLHSILTEQEKGTLQRLFTTPTTQLTLFSGKFLAALLILLVQVSVLLLFGHLVFGINWGAPLSAALAAVGLIVLSATTGLFLVSLLKSTRQAGAIFGGLLTLTGMLGMISVFTAGSPYAPPALDTISLLVPQGWAMRGMRQAMDGQGLGQIGFTLLVILLWSGVFFAVGQYRLRRRFQ